MPPDRCSPPTPACRPPRSRGRHRPRRRSPPGASRTPCRRTPSSPTAAAGVTVTLGEPTCRRSQVQRLLRPVHATRPAFSALPSLIWGEKPCLIGLRKGQRLPIDLDGVCGPQDAAGDRPRYNGVRDAVVLQGAGQGGPPGPDAHRAGHPFTVDPGRQGLVPVVPEEFDGVPLLRPHPPVPPPRHAAPSPPAGPHCAAITRTRNPPIGPNAKFPCRGGSGSYELGINYCRRDPVPRLVRRCA